MPITKQEDWQKWVEANQDPYGATCINVARQVMKILDEEQEFDPHVIICRADEETNTGGITGFMAGAVAQMVSQCHSRGEEFRKAWNKNIGGDTRQEESEGVLNPAILIITE